MQFALQGCGETKSVKTRNVRRFHHDAVFHLHRAGNDDRDGANLCAALKAATLTFARRRNNGAHNLARLLGFRRVLLDALVNLPLPVNRGRAQVRAAKVGGDDKLALRKALGFMLVGFCHVHFINHSLSA